MVKIPDAFFVDRFVELIVVVEPIGEFSGPVYFGSAMAEVLFFKSLEVVFLSKPVEFIVGIAVVADVERLLSLVFLGGKFLGGKSVLTPEVRAVLENNDILRMRERVLHFSVTILSAFIMIHDMNL